MNDQQTKISLPIPFDRGEAAELFHSTGHQEALARLQLMIQKRYLGVLTGEVGSGKSTLVRHLVKSLDQMRFQAVYISMADLKPRDFYGELLRQLGEVPPYSLVKAKRLWEETITSWQAQKDKQLVVIIDEAQDLSEKMLLELRFAQGHQMDAIAGFPLLLVGQPELRKTLRLKRYEAISQRVQLQYHLGGLTKEETLAYIRQQLKLSGDTTPVFAESSMQMIFAASQGIPRLINRICSQALLEAERKGLEVIEESQIGRVLADQDRQRGIGA